MKPDGDVETVYVELGWYDGPRDGIADVDGTPHYFQSPADYGGPGGPDDEYLVWPISGAAFVLEREQWMIFAQWHARYEVGSATPASHPGNSGVDDRYDELTALLEFDRIPPGDARQLRAEWVPHLREGAARYGVGGPSYDVRWTRLRPPVPTQGVT